jgi:hypothetical protein
MSAENVGSLGGNLYDRGEVEDKLSKADTVSKVGFTAQVGTIPTVFKADDEFVIWGPASVEVVDKEGDLIEASALSEALPQLLKRARLSLEHSDQLVGKILEKFETEQPVSVTVGDKTFERSEFPTDVMDMEGIEPALYVAGKVWDDSRQARETRRKIESGEIDSYSISGEALVTRTKVDNGEAYDEIVDMDLSAVTLCEEGMNQKAKFGLVTGETEDTEKSGDVSMDDSPDVSPGELQSVAKSAISKTMSEDNTEDGESAKSSGEGLDLGTVEEKFEEVIQNHLPDGELATKDDVEDTVHDLIEQQDRASTQDDTDDEGTTNFRHEDVENPFDREFSPAVVERMVDKITEKIEDKYDLEPAQKSEPSNAAIALAREYDYSPEEIEQMLEQGKEGDMPDAFGGGDDEEDEEEEMPEGDDDEMPEGDYEEDEEMEEGGSMEYSAEELERELPEDVFNVVSEYIEASDAEKSDTSSGDTDDGVEKSDIEEAVEDVLKGRGLEKTEGVEGASAAMGDDPEPSFEKGEDPDAGASTESHPALATIYEEE